MVKHLQCPFPGGAPVLHKVKPQEVVFGCCSLFVLFLPCHMTCSILVPLPGIERRPPRPQQWKHWILTAGPPGSFCVDVSVDVPNMRGKLSRGYSLMIFDLLFQMFVYCEKHAYKNQNENPIPDYKHSLKEFGEIDTLAISGDTDSLDIRDSYLTSLFKDCWNILGFI